MERVRLAESGSTARVGASDTLVVEAALELRAGNKPFAVLMRTPGHDHELVRGLLFAEGIIARDDPLDSLTVPEGLPAELRGHVVELGVSPPGAARSLLSSSSCGVCGKPAIADLDGRLSVCHSGLQVCAEQIAVLPERLRLAQTVFAATGGLHAAGAFDAGGELVAIREDVGRHNAVDKLVGWALLAGRVPCWQSILCVSGRLGFEIVQKAVAAGFAIVVAVSAPSSLAVDLAERYRITLCGFTRSQRFNVYSHSSRIV